MNNSVLELKDVHNFKVVFPVRENTNSIQIKGLVFSSSLGIKKIETRIIKDIMIVEVYIGIAKNGISGNLDCFVNIPETVNEVRFGHRQEQIWKRNSSVRSISSSDKK